MELNWIKIEPGCELPKVGDYILITTKSDYKNIPEVYNISAWHCMFIEEIETLAKGLTPYMEKYCSSKFAVAWMPCAAPYREVQP